MTPTLPAPSGFLADAQALLVALHERSSGALNRMMMWVEGHPHLALFFVLLALIPSIFWLWLYIRKGQMDAIHRRYMILTFVFGMFSVPLVFALDMAFEKLFSMNVHLLFEKTGGKATLSNFLYYVVAVGMLEEYSKSVIVKTVDYHRSFFNRIVDGIEFSIAAALGFAFVENILYFEIAWSNIGILDMTYKSFAGVVLVRSFGSMLAHVLFSGIFGYYYGRAKFLGDTLTKTRVRRPRFALLRGFALRWERIKHVFMGSHMLVRIGHTIHKEELIAEGLIAAILLHGLYDFFLDINLVFLIVPLLFLEYLFVWHELEVTENLRVHETRRRLRTA